MAPTASGVRCLPLAHKHTKLLYLGIRRRVGPLGRDGDRAEAEGALRFLETPASTRAQQVAELSFLEIAGERGGARLRAVTRGWEEFVGFRLLAPIQ